MPTTERYQETDSHESVWDFPRPPRLEACRSRLTVVAGGLVVAETTRGFRVLETSHPPVYYFPPEDVDGSILRPCVGESWCEWKGAARYYDIQVPERTIAQAAWYFPRPTAEFRPLANYVAFYPSKMDACYVGEEQVEAQPGDFYGGWITPRLEGPFKGGPGTLHW